MKLKLTEARIPSLRTLMPQEDVFHEPTPVKDFEREYSIVRGDLARGIDPQLKTVDIDPETAKLIPSTLLPEELRKIFPEGVVEGTVGAVLADYLQHHAASHLTPRGYLNYRQLTRSYLTPAF